MFSDLDFYMQDTINPIEIEITLTHLPSELFRESKFGLYVINGLRRGNAMHPNFLLF